MRKVATTLIGTALLSTALFASNTVLSVKVDGKIKNSTPSDKVWKLAKYEDIVLYPQTTIGFNDKKAVEIRDLKAKNVKIGSIYNDKYVAFRITWEDATKNYQSDVDTDSFGDGLALQVAVDSSNPEKLPYIGMGSDGRDVLVHLKKAITEIYPANGDGEVKYQISPRNNNVYGDELKNFDNRVADFGSKDYEKSFIAEGFRTTTEIDDGSTSFSSIMSYGNGKWSATIVRPLKDEYTNLEKSGVFPVAFAVWDGSKDNRDGLKHISQWIAVDLVSKKDTTGLSKSVNQKVDGDIENGKKVAAENCAACHNYADEHNAPEYMAPNLSNIGGYSTASYLKESIDEPNAVIVPGYNRNAHAAYAWYNVENGARVSTMPSYSWLADKDKSDLIAYLQTLKAEE